ncbi:MAG: 2-phospho-L-lactate transferase [Actinobacteria bacterium]|nr:2-phospho-L-lactate transferase [Actinomycetota bacterium]
MIAALAGGVGAARFLRGLVEVVDPASVTAVVNTADDDDFFGLRVCPDLDSVTYTLADAHDQDRGWGLAGETFATLGALARYGGPTWFGLGDRDLATHLFRTERLHAGAPLHAVTAEIARAWGLHLHLLPMTDDRVATRITVVDDTGGPPRTLAMQEWFVRERCTPAVTAVAFAGAADAAAAPGVLDALDAADTIVVCPSNPVISIGPILAVPGIRERLVARRDRVVAVSPIVGGAPVKGPADRLMAPLGIEVSSVGIARAYRDICATLVIDAVDAADADRVAAEGVRPVVTDTMMRDIGVAAALARTTIGALA